MTFFKKFKMCVCNYSYILLYICIRAALNIAQVQKTDAHRNTIEIGSTPVRSSEIKWKWH